MQYFNDYVRATLSGRQMDKPDVATLDNVQRELVECFEDVLNMRGDIQQAWDSFIQLHPEMAHLAEAPPNLFCHVSALNDLPEQTWLIEDEIPENGLTVLFGASGSGKSFQALDYAEQISQQKTVVYIAGEGRAGYNSRHKAWKHHHNTNDGNLYFWLDAVNMLDPLAVSQFIDTVKTVNPDLIIIDTLARCMLGGDENSAKDMGLFINTCGRLQTELNSAVLVVHHTGKNGGSERGSSALRGAADIMIELTNDDGLIKLACSKAKDSEGFATRYMRMLKVLDSCVLVSADKVVVQESPLTENQRSVIEWLATEVFDEGARSNDLMTATNIVKSSFYSVIKSLTRRGLIAKDGKYDPWILTDKGKTLAKELGFAQNNTGSPT